MYYTRVLLGTIIASYTSTLIRGFRGVHSLRPIDYCRCYGREDTGRKDHRSSGRSVDDASKAMYLPRGDRQRAYVDALSDPSVGLVFGIGPAGCGKTLFACSAAIAALKMGTISKIVLTRPSVAADEALGFLPGDILQKMNPMMLPLYDAFLEQFSIGEWDRMISSGVVEVAPIGFMRGRTFKNCFIIADEMQNSTPNQMLMLLTRVGEGSRMVVTGDLRQSDIGDGWSGKNGLQDFLDRYHVDDEDCNSGRDMIRVVKMLNEDVERSAIVKRVLSLYDDSKDP